MMPGKSAIWTIVLGLVAVGIFLAACALFHFPFETGFDVVYLVGLMLLPGLVVVLLLRQFFSLDLTAHEMLSLSGALGFGIIPVFSGVLHSVGIGPMGHMRPIFLGIIVVLLVLLFVFRQKFRFGFDAMLRAIQDVWIFAFAALLFFAAYNLQQFHYGADGSIVTHGLFGVDIPFLAGEVHGIRDFGALRDLHQAGQPWQYHDWTYQLLALLPRDRTLGDLAFAAPFVGYVMLALSIFTLALRLTRSKYNAYIAVGAWFLVSGLEGGELSSYALSPSFVFGSMIFLNVVLVLDLRLKNINRRHQLVFSALLLYLLIGLSQTKLSSYLVIMGGMGLIGLMQLISSWKQGKIGVELLFVSLLSFVVVLLQMAKPNPFMPGGDFLVGAPLLGYANHITSMLHVPISEINPVSHGLSLYWQSLFIVPFFVFHFLRFALVDPKILSAIIIIIILRKLLWQQSREIVWLLVLIIPLGFLLPVLYSPAWYPLALSFYAPLVSVQASVLLVVVGASVVLQNKITRPARVGMGLIGLVCLIGIAFQGHAIAKDDAGKPSVVPATFVQAMDYLQSHTNDTDIIATRRFDLDTAGDESFYWFSALSGRRVVSEGAKYGSLLGAVADTNSEKGMHKVLTAENLLESHRELLDTIFCSSDSTQVNVAIVESGAAFIVEDSSQYSSFLKAHPEFAGHQILQFGGYYLLKARSVPRIELLE
jgi:hypothetical protein